ncbi:MAG: hypothetical protein AAGA18_10285 [Verrucomicrobiota bacterium]
MIALAQKLPLVLWQQNRQVPLSEGWIAESIDLTAQQVGDEDWSWSEEVAHAITFYLQHEFTGCVIEKDDIEEIVRRSIVGIGYPKLADHIALSAPRVNIYLPDIARKASYELHFFQLLGEKLQEASEVVMVRGIKLEEIRTCVKIIANASRWKNSCQHLNDEIVSFTRKQICHSENPPSELIIS